MFHNKELELYLGLTLLSIFRSADPQRNETVQSTELRPLVSLLCGHSLIYNFY